MPAKHAFLCQAQRFLYQPDCCTGLYTVVCKCASYSHAFIGRTAYSAAAVWGHATVDAMSCVLAKKCFMHCVAKRTSCCVLKLRYQLI